MKHTLTSKAAELMRKNGRHRRWRRAFSGMAAVVVFITTYMLILPAITMENQAICGMAEHTHTDACYEMQLVCTQEETPEGTDVHVHGPECYEQQQVLTCTKQEGEGHVHSDACYGYVCGQEESAGHTHTDACYTEVTHRELTCTEPESAGHTHGEGCYDADGNLVCTEAESTGHTHGDSCYTETVTRELTCGQEESAGHTHTDACIGLICGQEEYEGHTHTDACYTTEDVLVCTEPTGHTHGDGCYEKVLVCDVPEHTHTEECYPAAEPEEPQEPELICTIPEHSHEDACYDADGNLICGMEEHTHTEECYAPVEIPEEETPTTAFPEEIPEGYVEYTFDNEAGLTVTAYAPEGAFGQDVQLFAEVLSEDSEEYAQAKENLDKAENAPEYTGMAAMDIRFVDAAAEDPAQAEEIEPDAEMGQVFVKIDAQALLPEDVDESTLAVQHHAKVSDGGIFGTGILEHTDVVVETVADISEETGDITATPGETALPETLPALADEPEMAEAATLEEPAAEAEETQPVAMNVEAEFAVNSFSTFTITWQKGAYKVILHYVDESGKELTTTGSITGPSSISGTGNAQLAQYAATIEGYTYVAAHLDSFNGTTATRVSYNSEQKSDDWVSTGWYNGYYKTGDWYYSIDGINWENWPHKSNSDREVNVYMVYREGSETFQGITPTGVKVNLFNYSADGYAGINFVNGSQRNPRTLQFFQSGSEAESSTHTYDWKNYPYNTWTNTQKEQTGGVYQGIVEASVSQTEDVDGNIVYGYPQLAVGGHESLDYLFNTTPIANAKEVYQQADYLFQQDGNGYYYYDAGQNFAKLDKYGDFELYSRASNAQALFAPFDAIDTTSSDGYHFGMTVMTNFMMPENGITNGQNMKFEFAGDDDVWVFIDGELVLDMGGIHNNYQGSIDFATGDVYINYVNSGSQGSGSSQTKQLVDIMRATKGQDWVEKNMHEVNGKWIFNDYSQHYLQFYYLERGGSDSNCKISFNLITIPENSLMVGKELQPGENTNDEITEYLEDTLSYTFKVLKAENGAATTETFIRSGTTYEIQENGITVDTGTVKEDGTFTLKAGQIAVFSGIKANSGDYVVQEIMDTDYTGQYEGVGYTVSGGGNETKVDGVVTDENTTYTSAVQSAKERPTVIFKNIVNVSKLSLLKVTKVIAPGSAIDANKQFPIIIKLDGESIAGAKYTITDAQGETGALQTVGPDGIISIKGGETINITEGILVGTQYEVSERNDDGYYVSYEGMVTWTEDGKTKNDWPDFDGAETASGTFEHTNSVVHIAVQNADYEFAGLTTLFKYLDGAEENDQYTFTFEAVEGTFDEQTYMFTPGTAKPWTFTVDTQGDSGRTDFVVGYKTSDFQAEDFDEDGLAFRYYKVQEIAEDDGIRYDTGYYVIGFEINKNVATSVGMNVTGVFVFKFAADGTYISPDNPSTRAMVPSISFTNSKIGELSIAKVVERTDGQAASGQDFRFGIVLKEGGTPLSGGPYNYTVYQKNGEEWTKNSSGTITFTESGISEVDSISQTYISLDHNQKIVIEGLPAAAQATITETTTAGYSTKWSGNTGTDNEVSGATVTTKPISEDPAVTCTNTTGAVLPSTGGMGTTPFLALGTLLTLGAGMLLVQRRRKEGSDAV